MKALVDVPVQRSSQELGQQVDAVVPGIKAVADRYIHQAVFARQRHGRFATFLGQRVKPRAAAPAHDHR
ncbi:hypothetical protein D3C83_136050 [compost metagenome]